MNNQDKSMINDIYNMMTFNNRSLPVIVNAIIKIMEHLTYKEIMIYINTEVK